MAASISPFGGLRGLIHLRQILSTIQTLVIPEQVLIPNAHAAFDEDGHLKEALPASLVDLTAARLVAVARALSASGCRPLLSPQPASSVASSPSNRSSPRPSSAE